MIRDTNIFQLLLYLELKQIVFRKFIQCINIIKLYKALSDCVTRVIPYWYDAIVPQVLAHKNVLVVAHGNSLRAIVKHIDNVSEQDIIGINIPTSVPLIYEFDANFKAIKNYYLADPEELKKKQDAVSNQGKKK